MIIPNQTLMMSECSKHSGYLDIVLTLDRSHPFSKLIGYKGSSPLLWLTNCTHRLSDE